MIRRLADAAVRALADGPTVARAYAGDRADLVHVHAGWLGRPHPCLDPRCYPQQLRTPKATSFDATPSTGSPVMSSTPVSR